MAPIEIILKQGDSGNEALQNIIDATKLLADVHYTLSVHRRFLLSNHLDSSVKKVSEDCPVDDWLFGENFSQCVKSWLRFEEVYSTTE